MLIAGEGSCQEAPKRSEHFKTGAILVSNLITLDRYRFHGRDSERFRRCDRSHLEKFGIARLDLLALRQHRGGIRLEQFQRGQRRMAGLFLDLRMKRAMREIIDQQLLSLRTKKEALEQPRRIRIRGATEHATGNDDE